MTASDIWDNTPGTQRKNQRYQARWKVALVFGNTTEKPIFQTLTNDLSITGISLQYHTQEKVDTVLTLLLAPPPINGVKQRIIKLKAVIMSCVPFRGSFRVGMRFIQDAELDKLHASMDKYVTSDDTLASGPEEDFPKLNF